MKLLAAIRFLRLKPFETNTDQGRRNERYRRAAISIIASVLSRAVSVALMILSVSVTLPYLGVERFGVWMTVASFAGLLSFLDLGVGNALTNHVANRAAADDPGLLCQTISGGLGFLAFIGVTVAAILWLVAANLPWHLLVRVKQPELLSEARHAAMCFALLFGLNIFTNGIQRVFAGMQQAYVGHAFTALGSLAACVGIWLAAAAHQGIPILLTVMLGSQSAAGLLLLVSLIIRKHFTLTGILRFAKLEGRYLFKVGGLYFMLQIGTMVGWGADSLIISSTLGAAYVAVFSLVQRLFQFATQPLGIINAPLWGAYADAHVRGDKQFIRQTLKKSMVFTLTGATLVAILLLGLHPWLIAKWTHGTVVVPALLVAVYAGWAILEACGSAFAMFLNGVNIVRQQVIVVLLFVIIALPLKIGLVTNIGLIAIPAAAAFAYLISHLGTYGFLYLNDVRQRIN